jgi:hypothetical protein
LLRTRTNQLFVLSSTHALRHGHRRAGPPDRVAAAGFVRSALLMACRYEEAVTACRKAFLRQLWAVWEPIAIQLLRLNFRLAPNHDAPRCIELARDMGIRMCTSPRSVLLNNGSPAALLSSSSDHRQAISLGDQGAMALRSGHSYRQVRLDSDGANFFTAR